MKNRVRRSRDFVMIGAAVFSACSTASPPNPTIGGLTGDRTLAAPAADFASAITDSHNRARAAVGSPPLSWDPDLAVSAQSFAETLAQTGVLQHSPRATRPGQRESLWRGARGVHSIEEMLGTWTDQKSIFRPGVFPDVSQTGNWADVAHYSQMIWRDTQRVGCGLASSEEFDFLVCRYTPPGNIDGRRVL